MRNLAEDLATDAVSKEIHCQATNLGVKSKGGGRTRRACAAFETAGQSGAAMFTMIVNLVIQCVSGAVAGSVFAKFTQFSLGRIGDAVAGAIGGVVGGQLFQALIPGLSGAEGFDFGALIGQIAIGGGSGAIVTALVSLLMNPIDY
jgi:uncharacterized membrane protein YeaQ/YmgE (transglycosylase-associated protein family)